MTAYTGWNGLLHATGDSLISGRDSKEAHISRLLRRGIGRRNLRLLRVLVNSGTGASAVENRTWRAPQVDSDSIGGAVTTEDRELVNRNTTAADQTAYNAAIFDRTVYPSSYPEDASGNGGGGKLGD